MLINLLLYLDILTEVWYSDNCKFNIKFWSLTLILSRHLIYMLDWSCIIGLFATAIKVELQASKMVRFPCTIQIWLQTRVWALEHCCWRIITYSCIIWHGNIWCGTCHIGWKIECNNFALWWKFLAWLDSWSLKQCCKWCLVLINCFKKWGRVAWLVGTQWYSVQTGSRHLRASHSYNATRAKARNNVGIACVITWRSPSVWQDGIGTLPSFLLAWTRKGLQAILSRMTRLLAAPH
jgi:hypothetical protein